MRQLYLLDGYGVAYLVIWDPLVEHAIINFKVIGFNHAKSILLSFTIQSMQTDKFIKFGSPRDRDNGTIHNYYILTIRV
jgi:hypothetical protein